MFSSDPASHEAQIRSKKGVIDDIKEKTKAYPKEIKKGNCEGNFKGKFEGHLKGNFEGRVQGFLEGNLKCNFGRSF